MWGSIRGGCVHSEWGITMVPSEWGFVPQKKRETNACGSSSRCFAAFPLSPVYAFTGEGGRTGRFGQTRRGTDTQDWADTAFRTERGLPLRDARAMLRSMGVWQETGYGKEREGFSRIKGGSMKSPMMFVAQFLGKSSAKLGGIFWGEN